MKPSRVIVVEDESIAARFLQEILLEMGVNEVYVARSAKEFYALFSQHGADLILMDINIKGPTDGLQIAARFSQYDATPIIFTTAYSDDETINAIVDVAAYGYVTKPFSAQDIEVAIRLAYKRYKKEVPERFIEQKGRLLSDTLHFNETQQQLYREDEALELSQLQSKVLNCLIKHIDEVCDYELIYESVWEHGEGNEAALRTLIYSLRKAVPELDLETISKIGYKLHSMRG